MRKTQRVEQLELVVQVVLEPQHDLPFGTQRLHQVAIAALEAGEDRAAGPPAAGGEECGALAQELRTGHAPHRALVEHVLPREHRSPEPRLPQRVAGALAVRDVQQGRNSSRLPAPAGEVARTASLRRSLRA